MARSQNVVIPVTLYVFVLWPTAWVPLESCVMPLHAHKPYRLSTQISDSLHVLPKPEHDEWKYFCGQMRSLINASRFSLLIRAPDDATKWINGWPQRSRIRRQRCHHARPPFHSDFPATFDQVDVIPLPDLDPSIRSGWCNSSDGLLHAEHSRFWWSRRRLSNDQRFVSN